MEIELTLESFTGFYNGYWELEQFVRGGMYNITEEYGELEYENDWHIKNFDEWKAGFAETYAKEYFTLIEKYLGISFEVKSASVWSPNSYNHNTDSIDSVVVPEKKWRAKLIALMDINKEKIESYIKKNHTSYSGFISFMKNSFNEWRSIISDEASVGSRLVDEYTYISYTLFYLLLVIGDMTNTEVQNVIVSEMEEDYDIWYPQMEPITDKAKEEWEKVEAAYNRMMAISLQPKLPGLEDNL